MTDGNEPISPLPQGTERVTKYQAGHGEYVVDVLTSTLGLTKREMFAAIAMQGMLANSGGPIQANCVNGWSLTNCNGEDVASLATDMADNLIAALNKDKEQK